MNTHVGIVGAMKNSNPIIFHNVEGKVYADPIDRIKNLFIDFSIILEYFLVAVIICGYSSIISLRYPG